MRSLSGWAIAVWVVAFALLILGVAVSTYNIDALRANGRAVDRSQEVRRSLIELISSVKDAETGQRGFVITGDESYLAPFHDAEQKVPERFRRFQELTDGDPFYDERTDRLLHRLSERFSVLRQIIEIRRQPEGERRARDEIVKGRGKAAMDAIRAMAREMEEHEQAIQAELSRTAQKKYGSSTFTALFGGLVTVLMVAMAFAIVRRELVRRQLAEDEARQTAEELAESERQTAESLALLDAFVENAPVGIAFFDPDLRYHRINESLAAANGRPVADHLGRPLLTAVPDMPAEIVSDLREVARTGRPLLNHEATGRPGAPDRTWLSSYFPVRTTNGRPVGVGVVALDVTDRLAAVKRLRESEARKAAILDTAIDSIISIDHLGRVVEFNPAAERAFGYTRAEAIGQEMAALIVPASHQEAHRRGLARYLATGEGAVLSRRLELPARRKDGTEFPAELVITAVRLAGQPIFTAYLRDVTERKRLDTALRQSLDRFRSLTEAIPQLVWNADANGRATYFNRRWIEYTGLAVPSAEVAWWAQVVHPDDSERLDAAWQQAVAGDPQPFEQEVRVRDVSDGTYRWFLTAVVPLRRPDGTVDQWIGSLSSIDEQKRQSELLASLVRMRTVELESTNHLLREEIAERTRAESRAQAAAIELRRSNEELEKFAYVASHDLQEPLRKIQAFGDRLTKRFRDILGPDGQDYVDRMKASAGRMRKLIDDLLAFSRVTTKAQPFALVDLESIARDVMLDLEARLAQSGGRVDLGELPMLPADPLQMRQLFQNLIGNALKFHRPGVPPVVTVRATPWSDVSVDAHPPAPRGTGWRITVADNGIGFDASYAERIFELFQRLHGRGEYEGTGIGLAIVRKIVQRHGGEITAHGSDGRGATFVIDLPTDGTTLGT